MTHKEKKNNFALHCRGAILNLDDRTHIMGVLNVTPDSFSDGGLYYKPEQAVKRALEMEKEGADMIDIGGESTRPGAQPVPEDQEIRRIIPVIESLSDILNIPISVDTRKSKVARYAVQAGAAMVNDISGLRYDSNMAAVVAELDIPIVIMHSRDDPAIMQSRIDYNDIISDIYIHLYNSIQKGLTAGIDKRNIIIDPGIGFGKTAEHNLIILRELNHFAELGYPILIGVSRKSFIGKILGVPERDRIMGTAAAVAASILKGAHIVRVHDIKAMKQVATVADHIRSY